MDGLKFILGLTQWKDLQISIYTANERTLLRKNIKQKQERLHEGVTQWLKCRILSNSFMQAAHLKGYTKGVGYCLPYELSQIHPYIANLSTSNYYEKPRDRLYLEFRMPLPSLLIPPSWINQNR